MVQTNKLQLQVYNQYAELDDQKNHKRLCTKVENLIDFDVLVG